MHTPQRPAGCVRAMCLAAGCVPPLTPCLWLSHLKPCVLLSHSLPRWVALRKKELEEESRIMKNVSA